MTNDQAQQRAERLVNRVMPDVIVATSVHDPSRSSTVDVSGWNKDFKKVITAALLAVQREKLDRGKLWSFFRQLIDQGTAIQQDYQAGKYESYEHFAARLDEAARERVDQFEQAIRGESHE